MTDSQGNVTWTSKSSGQNVTVRVVDDSTKSPLSNIGVFIRENDDGKATIFIKDEKGKYASALYVGPLKNMELSKGKIHALPDDKSTKEEPVTLTVLIIIGLVVAAATTSVVVYFINEHCNAQKIDTFVNEQMSFLGGGVYAACTSLQNAVENVVLPRAKQVVAGGKFVISLVKTAKGALTQDQLSLAEITLENIFEIIEYAALGCNEVEFVEASEELIEEILVAFNLISATNKELFYVRLDTDEAAIEKLMGQKVLYEGNFSITPATPELCPPPTAKIVPEEEFGVAPFNVCFDASKSTAKVVNPNNQITSYAWNFDDGSTISTEAKVCHTFAVPGQYNVKLVVKDDNNSEGSVTSKILVLNKPNNPPVITNTQVSGSQVGSGESVTLSTQASDTDGDSLSYTWTAPGGTLSATSGSSVGWTAPYAIGTYSIQVSVKDGKGGVASHTFQVTVNQESGSGSVVVQPQ